MKDRVIDLWKSKHGNVKEKDTTMGAGRADGREKPQQLTEDVI